MTVVRLNHFKLLMVWKITINYTGEVMEIQEANKMIIAEYMGTYEPYLGGSQGSDTPAIDMTPDYGSLDALVPVWEKLNFSFEGWVAHDKCYIQLRGHFGGVKSMGKSDTIQEAACIATAKAVEALR